MYDNGKSTHAVFMQNCFWQECWVVRNELGWVSGGGEMCNYLPWLPSCGRRKQPPLLVLQAVITRAFDVLWGSGHAAVRASPLSSCILVWDLTPQAVNSGTLPAKTLPSLPKLVPILSCPLLLVPDWAPWHTTQLSLVSTLFRWPSCEVERSWFVFKILYKTVVFSAGSAQWWGAASQRATDMVVQLRFPPRRCENTGWNSWKYACGLSISRKPYLRTYSAGSVDAFWRRPTAHSTVVSNAVLWARAVRKHLCLSTCAEGGVERHRREINSRVG